MAGWSELALRRPECWVIRNCEYRPCPRPGRQFRTLVSLHNHSSYSVENIAALNRVVKLWYMRFWSGLLQRAFGLEGIAGLDYADVLYHPPATPEDVWRLETSAGRALGFERVLVAITDHNEIAGGLELRRTRPDAVPGEELSFVYEGHLFHLGLTGLEARHHAPLQGLARAGRTDEMFELIGASGCLAVLNHPLLVWRDGADPAGPLSGLLRRFGARIHAFEYNGMRRRGENDSVLELARRWAKPVVGGGDSHMLAAASALCASQAETYRDFVGEVKSGHAVPLVTSDCFSPLGWKLTLRTLCFIAHYRRIASFRGQPVSRMLAGRTVLLDPLGLAAHALLSVAALSHLLR